MSERAKYQKNSQGNLIFAREKSGKCYGNLLHSNCVHHEL